MNGQESCEINRRVNYKVRKRSAEALADDSDPSVHNSKRVSATGARVHGAIQQTDLKVNTTNTGWIENSFVCGAESRHIPGNGCLNTRCFGQVETDSGRNATSLSGESDLNSSDLWLADVNLSALEATASSVRPQENKEDLEKSLTQYQNAADKAEQDYQNCSGDEDLFKDSIAEDTACNLSKSRTNFSGAEPDGTNVHIGLNCQTVQEGALSEHSVQYCQSVLKQTDSTEHTVQKDSTSVSGSKTVSLKDKLKNRLLQNASTNSPVRNSVEEARNESISKAQMEASQIRREWSADDVGPFYGLPVKVQELLAANRKITKLYDWQDQCLTLPAVYEGRNLIYTLPTSGGKTLVAEILILRQILCKKKDAILILPYISIVQEKVRILSEFATELGFLVEEYAGSKGRFPPTKRRKKNSLYVATIEKGQSLVNSLIETERLSELGLVVVDELHMIGEGGSRGAAMESTLLKILAQEKAPPQVIGMSATLNNIQDLATFLHAEVFTSNFRPVTLTEYVKVEDNMYQVKNSALVPDDKLQHDRVITFEQSQESKQMDPDHLLNLVLEIIPDNSCLLFCPTKRYCENVALMLARFMCKHHRHLSNIQKEKRKTLLQELHTDGGGKLCPTLKYTIHFGIAYHHSGLTTDERRLIEDAYSDGVLCLLTCTSTLAAGVNLPAKRVILRSPYVGADFLKHSQYKQMTGRAGRAGIDSSGESILIAKKADMPKILELLSGPQDMCHSSLMYQAGKGLRSLILSLTGLKVVDTTQSVLNLMQRTLLAVQAAKLNVDVTTATRESLQALLDEGLVVQKRHSISSPSQAACEAGERNVLLSVTQALSETDGFAKMAAFCSDTQETVDSRVQCETQTQLKSQRIGCDSQQSELTQVSGKTGVNPFSHPAPSALSSGGRSGAKWDQGVSQHILTPHPHSQQPDGCSDSQQTDATQTSNGTQLKSVSQHMATPFIHPSKSSHNEYDTQQTDFTQSTGSAQLRSVSQHTLTPFPHHLKKSGLDSQNTQSTQACNGSQLKGVSQHILTPFPQRRRSSECESKDTQDGVDCRDILDSCEEAADPDYHLQCKASDYSLDITGLGKATFKGSVDLECGNRLYADLKKAEQSLVVTNYLHLLYLVTPYDLSKDMSPQWMIYLQQLNTLTADEMKVAEVIGVPESYIVKRASGQTSRLKVDLLAVQRFYLTLMLYDLWKQNSVWDVAERFQQPRGFVQNLLTSAASFASCVLRFCQELPEFWAYQDLLGNFAKRLAYCVSVELIPLMEVPGVKLGRAKQLYSAGYTSLQSLAAAESSDLVKKIQYLTHKAARQIVSAAKVILEEKTEALLEQVEQLVHLPATSAATTAAATTVEAALNE